MVTRLVCVVLGHRWLDSPDDFRAGVAWLVALGAGVRGNHEVRALVIALVSVGALGILAAVLADPMGYEGGTAFTYGRGITFPRSGWKSGTLWAGPSANIESGWGARIMRVDDVVYAAGVILIGIAVLLHFVAE